MKSYSLVVLALAICLSGCNRAPAPPADSAVQQSLTTQNLELAGIKTATVERRAIQSTIQLPGQVNLTESGRADITSPLAGVVVEPLVKVGTHVGAGSPIAVINSIYGQTGMQILKNLEQDQNAVVQAQTNVTSAQGNLGTAESTLSQANTSLSAARISYNQAVDNLDQAKSELIRSRIELKRKQDLFGGGVAAKADVEDAQERYDKAVSSESDLRRSMTDAKRSVELAQENVKVDADNIAVFRNNVTTGQQAVVLAQANLERDKSVYAQSSLSGSNLPQSLTPVHIGGGGVEAGAAADTTSFYIHSPIEGTISNVAMSAGLSVSPGTIIATVVNTRRVYVDANAFETDLASIHLDDPVSVTVAAFPDTRFNGRVRVVGKQVDPTTRSLSVRSVIENPQDKLKPGMFVVANLSLLHPHMALVVPDSAILVHGDNRYIFVQTKPGAYDKRQVRTGISSLGETEIVSGVKAGDVVVTEGNLLLEGQE